jgi:hypothetical protein
MIKFEVRSRAFCTGLLAGVAAVALPIALALAHGPQVRAQAPREGIILVKELFLRYC